MHLQIKRLLFFSTSILLLQCTGDDGNSGDDSGQLPKTALIPCENGMAGEYPCNGFDLIGTIGLTEFKAGAGNDIWGWTDTATGKEYALMGLDNGTAFIDITNDGNLVYLGKLPTATVSSDWRDIKVFQDHAYIVSEAQGHGMQVFDLKRLRDVESPPVDFDHDAWYTGFGNAHNIVINESSGFAYAVGTDRGDAYSGGAHFINIQDPKNPVLDGGHGADGYTHDSQVVNYNGPDTDHLGQEIYIGANENMVVIVDVSDKSNPERIATIDYPSIGYTHQGWFTDDQRFFILGDELDEINNGFKTRTLIFDFADLDNPVLHHTYLGPTSAIDHNGYVKGNAYFMANYSAGIRMLDISGIVGKNVVEKGYFDTFPTTDNAQFSGAWSIYPYFESGKIIVSDINRGLFVIKASN